MKPVIFLNPFQNSIKLIIKGNNQKLKRRLQDLRFLDIDDKSAYYTMPCGEHYRQMLIDNTSDIAKVNTTYLYQKGIKAKKFRFDKSKGSEKYISTKKHLTIVPIEHKGKMFALFSFKYNPPLFQRLNTLEYVKYSKTYRRFVTHLSEEFIRKIFNDISPYAQIQLHSKIEINKLDLQKYIWEQPYLGTTYISCPLAYLERMRLKNYSINTMRTYHSLLLKFLNSFDVDLEIINSFNEDEINRYHREMIQSKKYAFSTINQSLNAIKYYYNEILDRALEPDYIERPRKSRDLPKVLQKEEVKAILKSINNLKHKSIIFLSYSHYKILFFSMHIKCDY